MTTRIKFIAAVMCFALNVSFAENAADSTGVLLNSEQKTQAPRNEIYAKDGKIYINLEKPSRVEVTDNRGRRVCNLAYVTKNEISIHSKGLFFVKIDGKVTRLKID